VFGSYRIDQFADPEGFKNGLGAVLEGYPDEVITYVCDPRTGIQRRSKFPPTISEIVEACDEHREFLAKQREPRPSFKERAPALRFCDRPPGYLAKMFVPEGHHRYAGLVEWAKEAKPVLFKFGRSSDNRPGIWISLGVWEGKPEIT